MKAYAQKAQSVVLLEGRILCEKLDKLNKHFSSDDSRSECEPLMKLSEKPVTSSTGDALIESLQEQIMHELKLNANYKEALASIEADFKSLRIDEIQIENCVESI